VDWTGFNLYSPTLRRRDGWRVAHPHNSLESRIRGPHVRPRHVQVTQHAVRVSARFVSRQVHAKLGVEHRRSPPELDGVHELGHEAVDEVRKVRRLRDVQRDKHLGYDIVGRGRGGALGPRVHLRIVFPRRAAYPESPSEFKCHPRVVMHPDVGSRRRPRCSGTRCV
jgi:hypothetical protein